MTDEGLGLTRPTERDRTSDVIGPDRDDADLGEDARLGLGTDVLETGQPATGMSAGRRVEVMAEEPDLTTTAHSLGDEQATVIDVEPGLADQAFLTDPMAAVGSTDDSADPAAEGNEVYVPPTDPVITSDRHGDAEVLGGFSPSASEEVVPLRSASDGQFGDEAIVDAVRSALRHDAATTDLEIEVIVVRGVVRLRGIVPGLEDVDNAEEVAGRVQGVVEVIEELRVATA
jgi:hypothetical protein